MKKSDLKYEYPPELVATEPRHPSRILFVPADASKSAKEIKKLDLFDLFSPGDVLVINQTKVVPRRVFVPQEEGGELEFLFLDSQNGLDWSVLFPAKKYRLQTDFHLPGGVLATLTEKGRPQKLKTNQVLDEAYFHKYAELPLPPYIQQARGERHNRNEDRSWYQTAWAEHAGSFAAPTASLHFTNQDLQTLESRGVEILKITLHVGLGTFLPVTSENLDEHEMHSEMIEIRREVVEKIKAAKVKGGKVWAMGTTATRALESFALNFLQTNPSGEFYHGASNLFIRPGFQWQIVDRLLTNFHQPESTLLALVSAFSTLERVKSVYQFAIDNQFRLFSYGDLSVWERK